MPPCKRPFTAVFLLLLGACGDGPAEPGPASQATIASGNLQTDTIGARLATPLSVRVADSRGRGVADVPVLWEAVNRDAGSVTPASSRTDADGVASANWTIGTVVGTYTATARVLSVARFDFEATVTHGGPHRVVALPADTALYVGSQFDLRVRVLDRGGNPTPHPAAFVSARPDVAETATSGAVTGIATGRVDLYVRAGEGADTVSLSVVPRGELVAYTNSYGSDQSEALYLFELDGSGFRPIAGSEFGFNTRAPRWVPGRDEIVFHELVDLDPWANAALRLYVSDTAGNVRPLISQDVGLLSQSGAQVDATGSWIYFTGTRGYGIGSTGLELWRVRPDGSAAERVSANPRSRLYEFGATPSADGRRIAYVTSRGDGDGPVIRILDLGSGAVDPIDVVGGHARWAPRGDEIAFLWEQRVAVVRSDGTGMTVLDDANDYDSDYGSVAWSPDAQWIVACQLGEILGDRRLVLIHRSSGERLPLPYTAPYRLCEADWRH